MKMSYIANLEMSFKKALKLGFIRHFNHVCHAGLSSILFKEGFPTDPRQARTRAGMTLSLRHSIKPDIFILVKTGHFYFGLTWLKKVLDNP
jgi:hypothetical protein